MSAPRQRTEYFRSKALTDLARDQRCQNCGSFHGVVSAHSNLSSHGKGKSIKAHDAFIAWLCQSCHSWLDQGSVGRDPSQVYEPTRDDKAEMWTRAAFKTWLEMWQQGLIKVAK